MRAGWGGGGGGGGDRGQPVVTARGSLAPRPTLVRGDTIHVSRTRIDSDLRYVDDHGFRLLFTFHEVKQ